jgi:hypothetical protein
MRLYKSELEGMIDLYRTPLTPEPVAIVNEVD